MRLPYVIVFAMIFLVNTNMLNAKNLTTGKAIKECQQTVRTHNETKTFKFKRKPAVRYKAGVYTFWMNFSTVEDGEADIGKMKCIVSAKNGEVMLLEVEPGRWRM